MSRRMDGHIFEKHCNGNKPRLPSLFKKKIVNIGGGAYLARRAVRPQTNGRCNEGTLRGYEWRGKGWNRGVEWKMGAKSCFFSWPQEMGAGQQVKYSSIEALHEPAGTLRWEERHYRIWTGMHNHGGTGGWVVGWLGEEGKGGRTYILVAVLLLVVWNTPWFLDFLQEIAILMWCFPHILPWRSLTNYWGFRGRLCTNNQLLR